MALFSLHRYAWNFPSNNHGQIFGIADSGVETLMALPSNPWRARFARIPSMQI